MIKTLDLCYVKNILNYLDTELFISNPNTLCSKAIKIYDVNVSALEPECLYICRASNLPDISNLSGCINIICLQDTIMPNTYSKNNHINMLLIKKQASLSALFSKLQDILDDNTDSKTSMLIHSVADAKELQHIINIGYKIIGNPFVMLDLSYRLLANTMNDVKDDDLWNELVYTGSFSHDTAYFFNMEKFVEGLVNAESTVLMKSDKLKYDRICGKIYNADGEMIASITVVACYKAFKPKDYLLIELLCEMISVELQNSKFYKKLERVYHETFICGLIEGKIADKNKIQKRVENLYKNLKENLYIAAIDITQYDRSYMHISYLRDIFEKIQKEFKYYIYKNNIVMLISTDNGNINVEKDLYKLYEFFKKYNIFAGISNSFQNLFELHKHYKQALNALNYGMAVSTGEVIFRYEDYRIDHLLNSLTDDINIIEVCHPTATSILKYDEENGTSYADIFYTYLQKGMNARLASEKLNMEQNILCEELEKIEDIFEIDRNDGNVLTSIFISFKLLKYLSSSL